MELYPRLPSGSGDYVVIVEEVKSTIQARQTKVYILVQDVCVEQTYDAIFVSVCPNDVGNE